MHHRLAEPNRVLAPRRSFRATATSWIGAGILHALVLILLLLLLAPVRESTTTTYLIPVEPGAVPIAADAPSEASPSAPEAGRSATVAGVTAPRATSEDDAEEEEGGLTIEVPAAGPTTGEGAPASSGAPLRALRGSTMPLIATPYGIGRRPVVRDQARITRIRAESLVNAMIASVIEVKPPMRAGPLSFPQGGGVSIPIPWGGFVRDDRGDETWRDERCGGGDDDEGDKPGEEEARGSQCD